MFIYAKVEPTWQEREASRRISFLDVLSAVPPFPWLAREAKSVERRDRSQSIFCKSKCQVMLKSSQVTGDLFQVQDQVKAKVNHSITPSSKSISHK